MGGVKQAKAVLGVVTVQLLGRGDSGEAAEACDTKRESMAPINRRAVIIKTMSRIRLFR
jgi:hypothetical protein